MKFNNFRFFLLFAFISLFGNYACTMIQASIKYNVENCNGDILTVKCPYFSGWVEKDRQTHYFVRKKNVHFFVFKKRKDDKKVGNNFDCNLKDKARDALERRRIRFTKSRRKDDDRNKTKGQIAVKNKLDLAHRLPQRVFLEENVLENAIIKNCEIRFNADGFDYYMIYLHQRFHDRSECPNCEKNEHKYHTAVQYYDFKFREYDLKFSREVVIGQNGSWDDVKEEFEISDAILDNKERGVEISDFYFEIAIPVLLCLPSNPDRFDDKGKFVVGFFELGFRLDENVFNLVHRHFKEDEANVARMIGQNPRNFIFVKKGTCDELLEDENGNGGMVEVEDLGSANNFELISPRLLGQREFESKVKGFSGSSSSEEIKRTIDNGYQDFLDDNHLISILLNHLRRNPDGELTKYVYQALRLKPFRKENGTTLEDVLKKELKRRKRRKKEKNKKKKKKKKRKEEMGILPFPPVLLEERSRENKALVSPMVKSMEDEDEEKREKEEKGEREDEDDTSLQRTSSDEFSSSDDVDTESIVSEGSQFGNQNQPQRNQSRYREGSTSLPPRENEPQQMYVNQRSMSGPPMGGGYGNPTQSTYTTQQPMNQPQMNPNPQYPQFGGYGGGYFVPRTNHPQMNPNNRFGGYGGGGGYYSYNPYYWDQQYYQNDQPYHQNRYSNRTEIYEEKTKEGKPKKFYTYRKKD